MTIKRINPERPKIAPGDTLWICDRMPCGNAIRVAQGSADPPGWVRQDAFFCFCPKHDEAEEQMP